ncbi:MAG: hypothetical protein V1863_04785 [Candidatus Omnitrophota bacterium]
MDERSHVVKSRASLWRRATFWISCGAYGLGMLVFSGCETVEGFKQDLRNIKISDDRFRERYW